MLERFFFKTSRPLVLAIRLVKGLASISIDYKQADYAHQNTSRSDQIENIGRKHSHKVLIIYSVQFSILYKNCETRNIFSCSNNSLLVCSLIECKNNYL